MTISTVLTAFLVLSESVIGIAVQPTLPGLCRCNDGMPTRSRVFSGVLVWRVVAAQSLAAFLTRSQMDPLRIDLHTLGAFTSLRLLHGLDRVEMITTAIGHNYFLLLVEARRR